MNSRRNKVRRNERKKWGRKEKESHRKSNISKSLCHNTQIKFEIHLINIFMNSLNLAFGEATDRLLKNP